MTTPTDLEAQIVALAQGPSESDEQALERIRRALQFTDATKFAGQNGRVDTAKVQTFAKALTVSADAGSEGSVQEAREQARKRLTGEGTSGDARSGSVRENRERVGERLARFGGHA
ncbi:hypothetical protein ACFUTX_06775 [Microbacterium sp. NPDC057407]|uniref:hypothetical protein n=1 Tax=Microbacterium sp. NPDC057407 TaxID=3346120 RepID=UPI00366CB043